MHITLLMTCVVGTAIGPRVSSPNLQKQVETLQKEMSSMKHAMLADLKLLASHINDIARGEGELQTVMKRLEDQCSDMGRELYEHSGQILKVRTYVHDVEDAMLAVSSFSHH